MISRALREKVFASDAAYEVAMISIHGYCPSAHGGIDRVPSSDLPLRGGMNSISRGDSPRAT